MTKTDSLDNITLDSDEIRTIERFENNYYNHKKNPFQNGGIYKLEKNIGRLFECYILSQNQIGGGDIKLTNSIENKLNKNIIKLILQKNLINLEGGMSLEELENNIKTSAVNILTKNATTLLQSLNFRQIISNYVNNKVAELTKGFTNTVNNVAKGATDLHKDAVKIGNQALGVVGNIGNQALGSVGNLFQGNKTVSVKK
jgi:hypothetical protein